MAVGVRVMAALRGRSLRFGLDFGVSVGAAVVLVVDVDDSAGVDLVCEEEVEAVFVVGGDVFFSGLDHACASEVVSFSTTGTVSLCPPITIFGGLVSFTSGTTNNSSFFPPSDGAGNPPAGSECGLYDVAVWSSRFDATRRRGYEEKVRSGSDEDAAAGEEEAMASLKKLAA